MDQEILVPLYTASVPPLNPLTHPQLQEKVMKSYCHIVVVTCPHIPLHESSISERFDQSDRREEKPDTAFCLCAVGGSADELDSDDS